MNIEITPLSVLATLAFGLLIAVTAGVGYLTIVDWRDRRRQDRERQEKRRSRR